MIRPLNFEMFRQIAQPCNLAHAFARYRGYRGLWASRLPMARVSADPVVHVLELAESLCEGRYRPEPPSLIRIEKADRSERIITVYPIRDRVVQRAALQFLAPLTEATMSPSSFGFRPGRSVQQAVAAGKCLIRAGYGWVVDADIERCFDSIPRPELLSAVRIAAGSAAENVVRTLFGWPENESGRGIPQGAVISPWLCNIYLSRLDKALLDEGIPQVRYADDFIALSITKAGAETALDLCRAVLDELRLRLHPVKTSVRNARSPFRFLGQALSLPLLLTAPAERQACC